MFDPIDSFPEHSKDSMPVFKNALLPIFSVFRIDIDLRLMQFSNAQFWIFFTWMEIKGPINDWQLPKQSSPIVLNIESDVVILIKSLQLKKAYESIFISENEFSFNITNDSDDNMLNEDNSNAETSNSKLLPLRILPKRTQKHSNFPELIVNQFFSNKGMNPDIPKKIISSISYISKHNKSSNEQNTNHNNIDLNTLTPIKPTRKFSEQSEPNHLTYSNIILNVPINPSELNLSKHSTHLESPIPPYLNSFKDENLVKKPEIIKNPRGRPRKKPPPENPNTDPNNPLSSQHSDIGKLIDPFLQNINYFNDIFHSAPIPFYARFKQKKKKRNQKSFQLKSFPNTLISLSHFNDSIVESLKIDEFHI